ncbi:5'-3' exonuclease [Bacillus sp. FJAT-44742]|uniref:5'-3' exonuclease n=1 Tax=Bacillus sp. FJAT-44742 TaxID=2014005 RepID=UPI000C23C031|nr:5'-3' exonuclease H3TH domain-containing protein [Bacillus sp. FJAT-44742]
MKQDHVLLVDGMALLFRGFFATSVYGNYMYNHKGQPTNGVNGFTKYFLHAVDTFLPTHIICCWDMGSQTFRTRLFPEYKANRAEPPVELLPQFDMAKQVMEGFEVPNIGVEDYEADDCIGTLASQLAPERKVSILTGDQDMLQLVDENIHVVIMKKGRGNYQLFDLDTLEEVKGCTPGQIVEMKGLMGDSSDNYPGVKGIGEKTALKLLKEYESIDQLIDKLDELPPGIKRKIESDRQMLYLSRELAEIRTDVPIEAPIDTSVWNPPNEKASQVLGELGLKIPLLKI